MTVDFKRFSDDCFCLATRRAARALSRRYDEAFRPLQLNNGQFSMLTSIAGLEPVSHQDLARHLAMDRTTVTAALKPLERRGLVDILVSPNDGRAREASLTARGRTLLARAMLIWEATQDATARDLGMKAATLRQHLRRLS